ncbi:PREDICTED: uncharacterized protein LOC109155092 [Ipomoea nil]|uniref:uncharacterized protein LOC109155092 n=1 Tax=Ipomoea nil TaxID=35883 RepID=UPI00090143FF|nr:PREDICTED: uncharacterized protein LOC109155092 [Ipomoea nil]
MGDMKKLQDEVRAIQASVEKLEHLPATVDALTENVANLTQMVHSFFTSPNTAAATVTSSLGTQVPETAPPQPADSTHPTRFTKLEFSLLMAKATLLFGSIVVTTAAYYMFDSAQLWYKRRLQDGQLFSWIQFKAACTLRFRPPRSINPLGELANLKQQGRAVDDFIDDFQLLLARADNVLYSQQVNLFTAGLDEILRIDVERLRPDSLDEAINIARDYARKGTLLRPTTSQRPFPPQTPPSSAITVHQQPLGQNTTQSRPLRPKKLSSAEMLERQKLGLCYNCDEKWIKGHRCKRHLYMLGIIEDEEDDVDNCLEDLEPEISLHAITGINHSQTMQIRLMVAGSPIIALVDSGSTDNFINIATAHRLHLPITPRTGLHVAVANGERMPSSGICQNMFLQYDSISFIENFFVIPLAGVELVLGVKWLRTLGPIWWNFETMQMHFAWQGTDVVLSGVSGSGHPSLHLLHQLLTKTATMDSLLDHFVSVFGTPQCLPPSRSCDHRIVLAQGTNPVVVRPYRYPHLQKDEIERQCSDMLHSGIIRPADLHYGVIAAPLTNLLRKHSFNWDNDADAAFATLKRALSSAPVLCLPNFAIIFVVECDASGVGIGVVLHQDGHPIAYFSRKLADRHLKLPAYERELIGLSQAVRHWRHYLWGREFVIKTDHYSLKYLLQQRLTTSPQQHWMSKLLGFDFKVEYKPGRLNVVADALSRRDEEPSTLFSISCPRTSLLQDIQDELAQTTEGRAWVARAAADSTNVWTVRDGLLFKGTKLVLIPSSKFIPVVLSEIHGSTHEGVQKTIHRIRREFYWPKLADSVREFIAQCTICQQHKWENTHPSGLLQSLPIPEQIWSEVSMDFIVGLPKVQGKSVILVVVDRLSKYAHFFPLAHPYTASSVARTTLSFSSAYHPQSDGQMEVVNRTIEMYLRCLVSSYPNRWVDTLPWAEYCYNTSFHSSLKTTPFQMVYGRAPPRLIPFEPGTTKVAAVDDLLQMRDEILTHARHHLQEAQVRMREQYDKHHKEVNFEPNQWVWIRLQHYRQHSLARRKFHKLSPRWYGPYKFLQRIGPVAYRVELPENCRIHNVFHVSKLKAFVGDPPSQLPTLPPITDGRLVRQPQRVLRSRLNRGSPEILVVWKGISADDATWEQLHDFKLQFPSFKLEDKLVVQEGSNDAFFGKAYQRRIRNRMEDM